MTYMNPTAIFWPMIFHVILVFGIYILMFVRRKRAVAAGNARVSQFRENQAEPSESLFVRNNLNNQFELPILFHIGCLGLFVTGNVGFLTLGLAWIFILSRYVHSYIHVTSNRIRYRQPAFSLGFLALGLMWLVLAFGLL